MWVFFLLSSVLNDHAEIQCTANIGQFKRFHTRLMVCWHKLLSILSVKVPKLIIAGIIINENGAKHLATVHEIFQFQNEYDM